MAKLLVSVRSTKEAKEAYQGGAAVIDIKEPSRGSLGRADFRVWRAIRRATPSTIPVSVAMGELTDYASWQESSCPKPSDLDMDAFSGIAYRKIGFAGSGDDPSWRKRWRFLRDSLGQGSGWIATAYADWERANAPSPDAILQNASRIGFIGVLLDTYDKSQTWPLDLAWLSDWVAQAHGEGLLTAVAGRLDEAAIARFAIARPDLFAVRGAACAGGDRNGDVQSERVAALVRIVRESEERLEVVRP